MTEAEYAEQAHLRRDRDGKARLKAEAGLTLLVGLLVVIVLAGLALIVYQGSTIRGTQQRIERVADAQQQQAQDVKALLLAQIASDKDRQTRIDRAVAAIAAEQRRGLVAHDNRVEELLSNLLTTLKGQPGGPLPAPLRLPVPVAPPTTEQPAQSPTAPKQVAPAPKPAPAPTVCAKSGKSNQCKK